MTTVKITVFRDVALCGLVRRYDVSKAPDAFILIYFSSLKVKEISPETSVNLYRPVTLHDVMYGQVFCSKGKVKVKVKFTLEQVTKAQRWSRGIAVLFL